MFTIWKETLKIADKQTVQLPVGATILSLQQQAGDVCIWFLCDKNAHKKEYNFLVKGTSHFIDRSDLKKTPNFVGTVVQNFFVWHIFTDCSVKSNA